MLDNSTINDAFVVAAVSLFCNSNKIGIREAKKKRDASNIVIMICLLDLYLRLATDQSIVIPKRMTMLIFATLSHTIIIDSWSV